MPNWTYNTIEADNKDFFRQFMTGDNFDFNTLIKMPEELNIEGSNIDNALSVYEYVILSKNDRIKNIYQRYNKSDKYENIDDFAQDLIKSYEEGQAKLYALMNHPGYNVTDWDESRCEQYKKYPTLIELGKRYYDNLMLYGSTTWYDWRCSHWGTKWNASETSCEEEDDFSTVWFGTAWSMPEPIFQKLCMIAKEQNVELRFNAEYEDGFVVEGISKNGEFIITNEYQRTWDDEEDDEDEDCEDAE